MTALLRLIDESPGATPVEVGTLRLASERVTLREVIRRRLEEEIEKINSIGALSYAGLIQPLPRERELNSDRKTHHVDFENQYRVACEAFSNARILAWFDGRQLMDLDEHLVLTGDDTITFIKLVPLRGG